MLSKLALRNVKRQVGNYLIYFMTMAFTVAMLFSVSSIIFNDSLLRFASSDEGIYAGLIGVVVFISVIVAFVLSYATLFMLKLRKREFGTYLTLGMTKRNILTIFLSETVIIGGLALGAGLVMGLFIYQGLSALMMSLLEMKFALAAYSPAGLLLTAGLVAGIFLLASLVSALYLKRASIYELIHGKKRMKEIRHPAIWFVITLFSLALMIGNLIFIGSEIQKIIIYDASFGNAITAMMILSVSMIMFHIGLARSLMHFLLKRKRFCCRGVNTFVLRSLASALGSNSVMLGFLAFLLTFAVIGINAAFVQKTSQEESLERNYPYDVIYADDGYESAAGQNGGSLSEIESAVREYADIENKFSYCVYTSGRSDFYSRTRWSGDGYAEGLTDSFVRLSDFNALIEPLGYDAVTLSDTCMLAAFSSEVEKLDWNDFTFVQNGKSYRLDSVRGDYPIFSYLYFYVVVPDEAVQGMDVLIEYTVYDTEDGTYDAIALMEELEDRNVHEGMDYRLREYGRQEQNSSDALLVIGALFTAAVFLFMAMAILALKILSGVAGDKQRYAILYRLGVGERGQSRTLFLQTFSFFMLPFAVPLLMSIPTAIICRQIMKLAGMAALMPQVTVIAVSTAVVMALVYFLYYIAAYRIARRVVVR